MTARRTAFTREQEPAAMHSSMSVNLDVGTTWIVVIDTNLYSGNFEHELASFTTGITDFGRGKDEAVKARNANAEMVGSLKSKSTTVIHDEYGEQFVAIRATPGRGNDGMGGHFDRTYKEDEKGYTAYESVAIFFKEAPTSDEMKFIAERANSFTQEYSDKHPDMKILGVYLIKCENSAPVESVVKPET